VAAGTPKALPVTQNGEEPSTTNNSPQTNDRDGQQVLRSLPTVVGSKWLGLTGMVPIVTALPRAR